MQHRGHLLGLLLVGTSSLSIAQAANAAALEHASRYYNIPAQPMANALNNFAEVTGVNLVASPQTVKGKKSHSVRGTYSPDAALDQLLRGTALQHHTSAGGSVIVETPAAARTSAASGDPEPVELAQNVPPGQAAPQMDQPAQQASTASGDETQIVITGVRASLERSRDIKRNATGVVDAVSAEEIGKFPDTNLAEALQRIPGVSIERRNGEGARVTVRGFGPQFNLVTVNGRQLATSDVNVIGGDQNVDFSRAQGRSFDFSNLASDGVSRLEVYKTGRAAYPSGGIGATINIVTQRPLDGHLSGFRGSIGAKAQQDTSLHKLKPTPEVSGVLTWSNPENTFGASIFGAYQKRLSAAASSTSNDWNILPYGGAGGFLDPNRGMYLPGHTVVTGAPSNTNELVAIPNDSRYHYSTSSRETINGSATVQFRPVETLTFTADALYARNRLKEDRSDQTNWFNRPFDTVTFDSDPVVATAVKLSEGALYGTKDIGFEQQHRSSKTTLYSAGLNAKWNITDQLTLELDGNTSKSKSVPDSPNHTTSTLFSMGATVVDAHSVDFTGPIPLQQWVLNDAATGNGNGQLDIGDLGTQQARTHTANHTQRVNQLRADLSWNFGEGIRLDLGGTYIDSKMLSTQTFTQQHLGDWGITHVGDVQQYAGNLVQTYCLQCRFDHYNPTNALIDFRGNAVDLLNALSPHYASLGDPMIVTGQSYDQVHEKVTAAYAQASWDGEIVGHKANLTGGLRWEDTKVTAFALVTQPSEIVWNADNDFSVVQSSQTVPLTKTGHYTNVLPAVDFKIEASRGLIARVSYSKTLARPEYQNLFASTIVTGAPNRPMYLGGVATGQTGNPDLKPLVSDNEDISLEYYYGRSNYVSAGLFAKQVQNFVGIG